MFRYGFLLVFLLALAGAGFVAWHVWRITPGGWVFKLFVTALYVFWMGLAFAGFFFTEKVSLKAARFLYIVGNTWWIVMLYLLMFFLAADLLSLCRILPRGMLDGNAALGGGVALLLAVVLLAGRIHYAHKYRETLTIRTEKPLDRPLTIVLASDLHLGYHNSSREFARWVDKINAEKPDLILIGGDIVDRSARPLLEEDYAGEFHRFSAPVISVLGNHEYYSDREASERFFREAEIVLLRDSLVRFRGVTVIGRDDRTNPHRQPLASLVPPADSSFTILLDHQPYHLEEAEAAGVDFQFSGHTHRGQVWPLSWVTDALYEKSWGHHRRGNTQYYVSSGIGLWGPRFRIGTRSEYLVLKLLPEDEH
jgi:predicted MPP superfamily phosphohydrolase